MILNREPERWREGIDPRALPLQNMKITEVLGFPYAANQVFYLRGEMEGEEGLFYLKYAHHRDANLRNEAEVLRKLTLPQCPVVVECGEAYRYLVTRQIEGERLSTLLSREGKCDASAYMNAYGRMLATIHTQRGDFPDAPHRRFHDLPERSDLIRIGMEEVYEYLKQNLPCESNRCFIHGDCHYANLLWRDGRITGVLDWELSGMGDREFDIAWALIVRPGQRFLQTECERAQFLEGYKSMQPCDEARVRVYMLLIYARFLKQGDAQYEAATKARMKALLCGG